MLVAAEDGDTVGIFAARHGLTRAQLLTANGLPPMSPGEAIDGWIMHGLRDPWRRGVITGGGGIRAPFDRDLPYDVVRRLGWARMTTRTRIFIR
jgi:hypothetical protein